jgi:hypothetical protein
LRRRAVVELPHGETIARIPVPGKTAGVVASVDERRVLVVSPDVGVVTVIDGVRRRVFGVLRGFAGHGWPQAYEIADG